MPTPLSSSHHRVHCPTLHDYWPHLASPESLSVNLAQLLLCHPKGMGKLAIASPDGDLTYQQLLTETCRTASVLEQQGLQPGERVLIALNDDHMQLCLTLGCWAVGAIPILINPQITPNNLIPILEDITPVMCIVRDDREAEVSAVLNQTGSAVSLLSIPSDTFLTDQDWRLNTGDPEWSNFHLCSPNRVWCIQYSSGTTGIPKGIMHGAHGLLAFVYHQMSGVLEFLAEDVIYTIPRTFFSYGILQNLITPLCINATTVRDSHWPNPERIIENIDRYRPSMLLGVPLHFQCILDKADKFPPYAPRFLFSGGAPLSFTLIQSWYDTFGGWLHNGIGSSETPGLIAGTYPHDPLECKGGSYSTPTCTMRLLDENGQPVPQGTPGELWVHNNYLALGYWNNPKLTAERFHCDEAGRRWYATGDMFSEDEKGRLYFEGRIDDCFKIKGRWVMPIEVEEAVLQHIPAIKNCLLIEGPMKNGLLGSVLFIETHHPMPGCSFDDDVRAALCSLEHYKYPTCCHVMPYLPTNTNGKPDRNALRQHVERLLAQHALH